MAHSVYLLRQARSDFYKIGVTSVNPESRISCLQTGNPDQLNLLVVHEVPSRRDALAIEADFLDFLDANLCVLRGEWFHDDRGFSKGLLKSCVDIQTGAF